LTLPLGAIPEIFSLLIEAALMPLAVLADVPEAIQYFGSGGVEGVPVQAVCVSLKHPLEPAHVIWQSTVSPLPCDHQHQQIHAVLGECQVSGVGQIGIGPERKDRVFGHFGRLS
jgi:hypothetical protein